MAQINRQTVIGDILDLDGTTAPFFLEMGMHCLKRRNNRAGLRGSRRRR